MLLLHDMRRAASRADWTAGRSKPTKTPMMAMTTRSSTKVNPAKRPAQALSDLFFCMVIITFLWNEMFWKTTELERR
jgi:hypothetical protein